MSVDRMLVAFPALVAIGACLGVFVGDEAARDIWTPAAKRNHLPVFLSIPFFLIAVLALMFLDDPYNVLMSRLNNEIASRS